MNTLDKPLKILIPNATSPRNIGDQAILYSLINIIKFTLPNAKIIVHSTEPNLYKSNIANEFKHTVYSYVAFQNRSALSRIKRILQLLIIYFQYVLHIDVIRVDPYLRTLVNDFKESDLIIFVGGGYLRTRKGLTQSLNLLMTLFMFKLPKIFKKKVLLAPMSFGPFSYKWQEGISSSILKNLDLVAVREQYSFDLLQRNNIKNVIRSHDHALLLKPKYLKKKNSPLIIGFTIRTWLDKKNFEKFVKEITKALLHLSRKNYIIQPIVQVYAPEFGEDDYQITYQIAEDLKKLSRNISNIKVLNNLDEAIRVYSQIDILIGMRMHSNILSAINGTPFLAISYEHKTPGISEDLGMKEYCIECNQVTEQKLFNMAIRLIHERNKKKQVISNSLLKIKNIEIKRWNNIITEYALS